MTLICSVCFLLLSHLAIEANPNAHFVRCFKKKTENGWIKKSTSFSKICTILIQWTLIQILNRILVTCVTYSWAPHLQMGIINLMSVLVRRKLDVYEGISTLTKTHYTHSVNVLFLPFLNNHSEAIRNPEALRGQ